MKKNKIMRIASVLLVAVLISTCAISGTFAKYVTKASGADKARVAKWGILVGVEGDHLFETTYATDDTTYTGADSVVAAYKVLDFDAEDMDRDVAPGTKGAITATVVGTPEVATRYTLKIADWEDIVLPGGVTYTDETEYVLGSGYTNTYTLEADYSPIKWDIVITNSNGTTIGLLSTAKDMLANDEAKELVYGFSATEAKVIISTYAEQLQDLVDSFVADGHDSKITIDPETGDIELSMDFDPNSEMDYTFALSWQWKFEGPSYAISGPASAVMFDAETVDKADTTLGNRIAVQLDLVDGSADTTLDGLVIGATVTATATQID